MKTSTYACALLSALLVSCGSDQEEPEPLCFMEQPGMEGTGGEGDGADEDADEDSDAPRRPAFTRDPRAEEWAQLLTGSSAHLGQSAPSSSCVNESITWPLTSGCGSESGTASPAELTEESVLTRRLGPDRRIVWVQTHTYPDGDALGPVALVERVAPDEEDSEQPDGWAVRVVGPLRLPPTRASLRLEGSGNGGLLIAEGERCPDPEDQPSCERIARMLPVVDDRFVPVPLRTSGGRCIGRSTVFVQRRQTIELRNGWDRTFVLAASYGYDSGTVALTEQVTIDDRYPVSPEVPERRFRLIDSERVVRLQDGELTSNGEALWDRAMRLYGNVWLTDRELEEEHRRWADEDTRERERAEARRAAREKAAQSPPPETGGWDRER